ncbi:hypothetical protein MKS88_003985 [Plasmodium brasilianum]|uniref:Uncharacterized protein n=1 Tax=Plasmodium brasilianum TaxID=5824 RepID=A0ACB9Y7U3_PLABR|nr:hypothetical protein MKS88_003985 [Plasmodium brasilianum]
MIKKCGLRVALPILLFFVLVISFILDNFCGCGLTHGLLKVIVLTSPAVGIAQLREYSYLKGIGNLSNIINEGKASPALLTLHIWLMKSPLKRFTQTLIVNPSTKKLSNYCASGFLGFLIYFVPIFILSIILISGLVYYHKKVKKYEKIKFRKR